MPLKYASLDDIPESVYAAELRKESSAWRFSGALEAEYLDEHLRRVRPRARIWTALGLCVALGFSVAQWLEDGRWTGEVLAHFLVILPISLLMTWLAWAQGRMRLYLRFSTLLAPVLGASVAAAVAQALTRGAAEELAMLTLLLIAAFFFIGLLVRGAAVAAMSIIAGFAIAAPIQGVSTPLYLKCLLFLAIAGGLGMAIGRDVERSYRKRFLEQGLIRELIDRDGLTGLKNRRAFDEHSVRVWQQSLRARNELAFLIVDVDYFKRYNDRYGHQAGDAVLRRVAGVIGGFARRPLDIAARYGGEEFVLVVFDISALAVRDIAERMRTAIESLAIEHAGSECSGVVTASIGVAIVQPAIGRTPKGALQLADEALYEAKQSGRNRCVIAGQAEYAELKTGKYRKPGAGRPT